MLCYWLLVSSQYRLRLQSYKWQRLRRLVSRRCNFLTLKHGVHIRHTLALSSSVSIRYNSCFYCSWSDESQRVQDCPRSTHHNHCVSYTYRARFSDYSIRIFSFKTGSHVYRIVQGQSTITTAFRINIALGSVITRLGYYHSKLDHTDRYSGV
jgi:hypothetical protein